MGAIGTWQPTTSRRILISRGLKATDKIDHNYDIEGGQADGCSGNIAVVLRLGASDQA